MSLRSIKKMTKILKNAWVVHWFIASFSKSDWLARTVAALAHSSLRLVHRAVILSYLTYRPLCCVCPSKARVNPGRLSSPTWKRPLNGCLPQSANTLAETGGGSGAGSALRHGSLAGAGSASFLSPSYSVMRCRGHRKCTHSRQTKGGRAGVELCLFLSGSKTTVCCGGFPSS